MAADFAQIDPAATTGMPASPVPTDDRVELIDIVRGFAVFGILLVNMPLFFSPIYLYVSSVEWWPGTLDRIVSHGIAFVGQGKFYTIFSFLFGVGLAIQMERAKRRGGPIAGLFARRIFWLALIGATHAFLIWFGDILLLYAMVGLVLLAFRNLTDRGILIWVVVLLLVPVLLMTGITGLVVIGRAIPESGEAIDQALAESREQTVAAIEPTRIAYAEGSFADALRARAGEVGVVYSFSIISAPQILGLFLIGLVVGRRRWLQEPESRLAGIRRALPWLLGVGIVGNLVMVATLDRVDPGSPSILGLVQWVAMAVGAPTLSFAYVGGIVLLYRRRGAQKWLSPLAAVGRMALTNYLMHSLVFTLLANGYGAGLYGRISPGTGLWMTLAMYAAQIPLSVWWLNRFRFGPAEWLWRSLTYRRLQPMTPPI